MEQYRDIQLPVIVYGNTPPPVIPHSGSKLTGVATSKGYYTGRAKVIPGLQAFCRFEPGDILVIPYSDIGWAPLFARAGAVIAESGGMLSHSSIIAREYGIPAVVSVIGAMEIPDNCLISVDAYKGEILIHGSDQPVNGTDSAGQPT
jgi:phosphohistidine swiveling domain-containing protein